MIAVSLLRYKLDLCRQEEQKELCCEKPGGLTQNQTFLI